MKVISTVPRYLLGLMFTIFGINGFFHFIPQPPQTNPLAIQFFSAVSASHYAYMFFAVQIIAGLFLLTGFFVPLALVFLAAELLNIATFHFTMDPGGLGPAFIAVVLWLVVVFQYRASFVELSRARQPAD